MLTDLLTAEVVAAFDAQRIPSVLMKGPVIAGWLYPADRELRPYGDADLLVPPVAEARASAVLVSLGFRNEYAAFGHPRIGPQSWRRAEHEVIDLHTTLWGIACPPEDVWRAFSHPQGGGQEVGGRLVNTPPLPARALQLALHAAQHPEAERTKEDVRRGIRLVPRAEWEAAASLSRRLRAEEAFAAGLRRSGGPGHELAAELGLPVRSSVEAAVRAASVPLAEGFEELAITRGLGARLDLLRRELVPSPDFMRWWSPVARRGRVGLALSYALRIAWIPRRAPAGYRAWRRAREESRDG